jgi:hypothetical protein
MAGGSELAEFVTCFGDIKRFPHPVAGGIDSDNYSHRSYELGHRRLVNRCRSVPHAGISSVHRLVEGSSRSRKSRVCSGGGGGGRFCRVGVSLNAG